MQIILDISLFIFYTIFFLILIVWTWRFYFMYVSQKFMASLDFILLEIRLPREIFKSPESMEIVANAFLQGGGVGTWYNRNWQGKVPTFFSLEIASIEGDVRFFVRTEKKFKELISNNFYSQYPGIEIVEAEDYVTKIFYEHRHKHVGMWGLTNKLGADFSLPNNGKDERKDIFEKIENEKKSESKKKLEKKLKMPADYKMLKTYIDFKQDKDPKEEFKHDPLTPVLEWLGSMKKGEHAWYQIVVQDTGKFNGEAFPKTYHCEETHESFNLKELADERRKQIRSKYKKPKYKKGDLVFDKYGYPDMRKIKISDGVDENGKDKVKETEEQRVYQIDDPEAGLDEIKDSDINEESRSELTMINRKLQKPLLRASMRVVYIAKKDVNNFGPNIQSTLSIFRQFGGPGYNSLVPNPTEPYSYSWENTMKRRVPWRTEEMFEAYVEREGMYKHLEERSKPESAFGKFFLGYGVDHWADISLFKYSLGTRKIIRLMYEGIFHPFHHPHADEVFTINLEELATLWHLPGTVATTPGIKRVDSIKSDAPDNLPR